MKTKIATFIAAILLTQTLLPNYVFAGALEAAISGTDASYTLTGNYTTDANLPLFGTKVNNTFSINSDIVGVKREISPGNLNYSGFMILENQTLNLTDIILEDFDMPVNNLGTLNLDNVDLDGVIMGTGITNINGHSTNNGDMQQYSISLSNNATLTNNGSIITTGNLSLTDGNISGNGSLEVDGLHIDTDKTITQNTLTTNGMVNNHGTINADTFLKYNGYTNNEFYHYGIINGDITLTPAYDSFLFISSGSQINGAMINNGGDIVFSLGYTNTPFDITGGITRTEDGLGSIKIGWNFQDNGGNVNVKSLVEKQNIEVGYSYGENQNLYVQDTNGLIKDSQITINQNNSLYADASKITNTQMVNNGNIYFSGGANGNKITGSGTLNIIENTSNNSLTQIKQNTIKITSGKTFTNNGTLELFNLLQDTGTITNNGNLKVNLLALNENGLAINGTGSTTTNLLTINENASITQNAIWTSQGGTNRGTINGNVIFHLPNSQTFHNYGTINGDISLNANSINPSINLYSGSSITGKIENNGGVVYAFLGDNGSLNITGGIKRNIGPNLGEFWIGATGTGFGTVDLQSTLERQNILVGYQGVATSSTLNAVHDNALIKDSNLTIAPNNIVTAKADYIINTDVENNGTLNLNGGTLSVALSGTGNTNFNGDISLATTATTLGNFTIAEGKTLTMNQVNATAGNVNINGTLNMGVASITKDSSVYSGAKLLAANTTLGQNAKLHITFDRDDELQKGDSTDWLTMIDGNVSGNWAELLSNNRYQVIAQNSAQGLIKVKYVSEAETIAKNNGANSNEIAAANAWDYEDSSDPTSVAGQLNDLSQHDAKGYVNTLKALVPVQAPLAKIHASHINQSIYSAAANHLQYGGAGLAAGDSFAYKSVWLQGLFNNTDYSIHSGFDGNTYGIAAGMDIKQGQNLTLGLGYAYTNSNLNATSRDIKINSHNIFLYGNYKLEDWYFDAMLGYNNSSYEEKKTVLGTTKKADYDVNSFAIQTTAQYKANAYLTPLASLRYIFADQASYKDGFGQKISSSKDQTLTAVLGTKVGHNFKAGSVLLKPEFKLAAVFDLIQNGDNLNVSTGLNSYSVKTEQFETFGVETGLKVLTDLTDRVQLALSYDAQFRKDYYNHTAAFNLRYNF